MLTGLCVKDALAVEEIASPLVQIDQIHHASVEQNESDEESASRHEISDTDIERNQRALHLPECRCNPNLIIHTMNILVFILLFIVDKMAMKSMVQTWSEAFQEFKLRTCAEYNDRIFWMLANLAIKSFFVCNQDKLRDHAPVLFEPMTLRCVTIRPVNLIVRNEGVLIVEAVIEGMAWCFCASGCMTSMNQHWC